MVSIPGAVDPLAMVGSAGLPDERPVKTAGLTPAVISIPEIARDPGQFYRGSPAAIHIPAMNDQRGAALAEFGHTMTAVSAKFKAAQDQRTETENALFNEEYQMRLEPKLA